VTKSDGTKFGKTADGAVWLDPARTSPYQFRQFWIQQSDEDAIKFVRQFSLASLSECESVIAQHLAAPEKRLAQKSIADEMTALVHGDDTARAAATAADILFGGDPTTASSDTLLAVAGEVPSSTVSAASLSDLFALMQSCGLATSNGDARRTLTQGGVRANGQPLTPDTELASIPRLQGRWVLLRKGKTNYHLLDVVG
jgi:tyrosyl-tRNA synthetase